MSTDESKNEISKNKDSWDKWHIIANSFAILLVPILVGYFGYQINAAIKDKEISQKYVELAIGILRGDPDKESPALREWAINIINTNSLVKLDPKAREELKRKPLRPVRLAQPLRPNVNAPGAPTTYLIDEKGNVLADEKGNLLTSDSEPLTAGGEPLTFGGPIPPGIIPVMRRDHKDTEKTVTRKAIK